VPTNLVAESATTKFGKPLISWMRASIPATVLRTIRGAPRRWTPMVDVADGWAGKSFARH